MRTDLEVQQSLTLLEKSAEMFVARGFGPPTEMCAMIEAFRWVLGPNPSAEGLLQYCRDWMEAVQTDNVEEVMNLTANQIDNSPSFKL